MPIEISRVTLTGAKRLRLTGLVSAGKTSARAITRARVLLKTDQTPGRSQGPGGSSCTAGTHIVYDLLWGPTRPASGS